MAEDFGYRVGAIILPDEGGIRPTFYVNQLPGGDYDFSYGPDGEPQSESWNVFTEILNVVRGYYAARNGAPAMVAAAVTHGAVPNNRREAPPVPSMPTPGYAPAGGGYFCKQCGGPAVIRPDARGMKGKFAPYNMQYPAECQSGCVNPSKPQYPLATWVER